MIQLNDEDDTSIFQKLSLRSYGKNNNKTKTKTKNYNKFFNVPYKKKPWVMMDNIVH